MIQQTLERVLALSRADDCMAVAVETTDANVRWANNTSTTNGLSRTAELFVISIIGGRVGTVGVSHFPDEDLETIVRRAEAACEGKPPAEDVMPLLEGTGPGPGWDDAVDAGGIEVFRRMAPELGGSFRRASADGVELFGYAAHTTSTRWLATSAGIRLRHTQREGRVELNAKSPDFARSAWVGQPTTNLDEVDVASLYEQVAERLAWCDKRIELPPGRYPVLLEPSAVADMLFYSYWSGAAREADEGRSVFSRPGGGNRTGDRLYPPGITLHSDPHEPGLEVPPFTLTTSSSSRASVFDNGMATSRTEWVSDGTLKALVNTRHWAERSGTPVTPWIDNLVLECPDGPTLDEMIGSTDRALLVTCFWYIRELDPQTLLLTGLTRDGVYLVEDGRVKGAVNNFRYNMSPVDMLAQTVEVGRSAPTLPREFADWFRFAKMPPLRVDGFNMSSVSQAT